MKERQRENWIDLVKCVAMTIVVMNHAQWIIPGVNFLGGMFFVPVFFVLSGYTWREKEQSLGQVLISRAKRLLLPYSVSNLLLCGFFAVKGGLSVDLSGRLFASLAGALYSRNQLFCRGTENRFFLTCLNSPTWFLTALFVTLLLYELLFRLWKGEEKKLLLSVFVLCLLSLLYHRLCPLLLPWSLDAAGFFLLFFACGRLLKEKELLKKLTAKPLWGIGLAAVFLAAAFINGSANFSIADYGKSTLLALFNALASSVLIMWLCSLCAGRIKRISFVMGRHTLMLLCWHLFVLALLDSIFSAAGLPDYPFVKVILTLLLLTLACECISRLRAGRNRKRSD